MFHLNHQGENQALAPLAITVGEPAGIGPDICVTLAQQLPLTPLVLVGDRTLLQARAQQLGLSQHTWPAYQPDQPITPISIDHVPLAAQVITGQLNPANSPAVVQTLAIAADGCEQGHFSAMVTAPLHKGVINDAGIAFTGHTEYLAERLGVAQVVMMLAGGGLRVALATTHLPLSSVAAAITSESLERTLRILRHDLIRHFGIRQPHIVVAGLNPHAGESGHLGREEIDIITPLLERLRHEGWHLTGPLPADTLFQPQHLKTADCVLAMYHDQGLPVLKYASFGRGINITLGLPIIRTSVDHGTALDIAGTGHANTESMQAAIDLAIHLGEQRMQRHRAQPS